MTDIEARIKIIEDRNLRVQADKAWEVSWFRRGLIAAVTYVCAFILLNIIGHEGAWKHAFVPVVGYILSTLSLPPIKAIWIRHRLNR